MTEELPEETTEELPEELLPEELLPEELLPEELPDGELPDGEDEGTGMLPFVNTSIVDFDKASLEDMVTRNTIYFSNVMTRNRRVSYYADGEFDRAIRILMEIPVFSDMQIEPSQLEYFMLLGGRRKVILKYQGIADEITRLTSHIDHNKKTPGLVAKAKMIRIEQTGGGIRMVKVSFSESDAQLIEREAIQFGVSTAGYLIVCFWMAMVSCTSIPNDCKVLVKYGKGIVEQFERALQMKLGILQLLEKNYP